MPTVTLLFVEQVPTGVADVGATGPGSAEGPVSLVRAAIRAGVGEHGGTVVEDSNLVVAAAFARVADAIDAARSVHAGAALASRCGDRPPVRIRMGIHTGTAVVRPGGGVFGVAALVGRRLCARAEPGDIHLTAFTYSQVAGHATFSFRALGPQHLDGIDDPVETWALAGPDPLASFATPHGPDDAGSGTLLLDDPDAHVALTDAWRAARDAGRSALAIVAGPELATTRTIDALRRAVVAEGGLDLSRVLDPLPDDLDGELPAEPGPRAHAGGHDGDGTVPHPHDRQDHAAIDLTASDRPGPPADLHTRLQRALGARLPPSWQQLLLGAPGHADAGLTALVGALACAVPLLVTAPAATMAACRPEDLAVLGDLATVRGVTVVVAADDDGRLATSPIATLLSAADLYVRVGTAPGSSTTRLSERELALLQTEPRKHLHPGTYGAGTGGSGALPTPEAPSPRPRGRVSSATIVLDGRAIRIPGPGLVIGRGHESDLQVQDPDASRRHARVLFVGSGWLLEDLGSTNGTMVNGSPVREHRLADGDVISVGTTELRFQL